MSLPEAIGDASKGVFKADELVLVNFLDAVPERRAEMADTVWVEDYFGGETPLYAPDAEGTTSGSPNGYNALIRRADLLRWREAAEATGYTLEETALSIAAGRYGDGNWNGVELVPYMNAFIWVER